MSTIDRRGLTVGDNSPSVGSSEPNPDLAIKTPVRVATTVNITLSGEQTIDAVAVVANDRVLVKNQTSSTQNGIYLASTGNWARTTDFDGSGEAVKGTITFVNEGTAGANTAWKVSASDPITPDTTSLTFAKFTPTSSAGGSTTQLQYNNAGALAGITGATSDGTSVAINGTVGAITPAAGAFTSLSYSASLTGTLASANAIAVGRQGTTNPAFNVDSSTALQVTGLKITGKASGGYVDLQVTSSATNEGFTLNGKGSANVFINNTGTGITALGNGGGGVALSSALTYASVTFNNGVTGGTGGNLVGSNAPTITNPNIVGTTTNNDAAAGSVGELIESEIAFASAVSLTSGASANVTSISLTAGDWDVWGMIQTVPAAGTTTSYVGAAVHTTSAVVPNGPNKGAYNEYNISFAAGVAVVIQAGMRRYSLASPTTVYLVTATTFAVSTLKAYGYIGARRVR